MKPIPTSETLTVGSVEQFLTPSEVDELLREMDRVKEGLDPTLIRAGATGSVHGTPGTRDMVRTCWQLNSR